MKKKYITTIIILILSILIDQMSKLIIINTLKNTNDLIIIDNFFKFSYLENTGAAFGILNNSTIILMVISLFLIYYLIKEIKNSVDKLSIIVLSFILSGAIGNLIDRLFRGYVVDFISFTLFGIEMPLFNIADIFISIGVILLIPIIVKGEVNDKKSK